MSEQTRQAGREILSLRRRLAGALEKQHAIGQALDKESKRGAELEAEIVQWRIRVRHNENWLTITDQEFEDVIMNVPGVADYILTKEGLDPNEVGLRIKRFASEASRALADSEADDE